MIIIKTILFYTILTLAASIAILLWAHLILIYKYPKSFEKAHTEYKGAIERLIITGSVIRCFSGRKRPSGWIVPNEYVFIYKIIYPTIIPAWIFVGILFLITYYIRIVRNCCMIALLNIVKSIFEVKIRLKNNRNKDSE